MTELERHSFDVVVIGAGGAGLRAAIEARLLGKRVAIVCKSLFGKAHTVMAEGGCAAAMGNANSKDSANWPDGVTLTARKKEAAGAGAGAAVVAFGVEAGAAAEVVAFGVDAGALEVAGAELAAGATSVATGVGVFRVSDPADVPADVPPAAVPPDALPDETGAAENPLLISAARPA